MRFGSATAAHGQIESPEAASQVQYGPIFLSVDGTVAERLLVFDNQGRFHPWRILPNALLYIFDVPIATDDTAALHRSVTEPVSGYGHIEAPRFGMFLLWPTWIALMFVVLLTARPRVTNGFAATPLLIAAGIAAAFMLSYPTVAFRYRFDVWPLVMAICLLGFPGVIGRYGASILDNSRILLLTIILLFAGLAQTTRVAIPYMQSYQTAPGRQYDTWDFERCAGRIAHHAFTEQRISEICIEPNSVFIERSSRRR